ncbi:MAG TPA: hypothetical protein PKN50_05795, partial [Spirochaetota bacterium]|nr:hypothetical protein [Spirochaetota bacterium]HPV41337.1 hypothetical protein [Spirochaetota bacterium]
TDEMLMVYAKNDRVQRLYSLVLAEMITAGKRDGSGRWCLLNKDAFVRRAVERLKWERNSILSVLAELVAMERLRVKKDGGGTEWIAYRLG